MRRIRIVVEYDGTDFCGWQRQANGVAVQQVIEEALDRMTGEKAAVRGAGRTDAGVHAEGQVAAFSTEKTIPLHGFLRGLNGLLPPAVAVVAIDEVPESFDPRFDALGKLYRYRIWNAPARSPLRARTSWHVRSPLDEKSMDAAAARFDGEHDFRAFRAADCERRTTVRRVSRCAARRDGGEVTIEIEATAFLKNMVRIIAGTLVEVGLGKRPIDSIDALLTDGRREEAGVTAPARGLTLVRVDYALPLPPR